MTEQITPTPQTGLGAPSVLVEPGAHATAGTAATLRVHVRNLADDLRDVTVTVLGLDDGWAPEPVLLVAVEADTTVSTDVVLAPVTGAMAGDYPFVVVVQAARPGGLTGTRPAVRPDLRSTTTAGPGRGTSAGTSRGPGRGADAAAAGATTTSVVESVLTVDAPSEVLLTVEPADSRIRLRRRLAVVLSNTGVEPVELSVETRTSRGLGLDLSARRLTVPGRQTIRLTATARNMRPQVLGHLDRRTFSVVAQGRQAPATFHGTVTARPLVGSGMLRVVALLMVVVLWGGGLLVALPWFTDRADQQTEAQPAPAAAVDAGDGTGPDGAGPDGAPGDGTGPDGTGAPGDGSLAGSGADRPGQHHPRVLGRRRLWHIGLGRRRRGSRPGSPDDEHGRDDRAPRDRADPRDRAEPGDRAARGVLRWRLGAGRRQRSRDHQDLGPRPAARRADGERRRGVDRPARGDRHDAADLRRRCDPQHADR